MDEKVRFITRIREDMKYIPAWKEHRFGRSYDFKLSAKEIYDYYKKRWNIAVFFRFVKQELNADYLLSLNHNGIQMILYMTLIVAMLMLIYKRGNDIDYKTAKRRFRMEIRDIITALIVIQCDGDTNIFFKTKKNEFLPTITKYYSLLRFPVIGRKIVHPYIVNY